MNIEIKSFEQLCWYYPELAPETLMEELFFESIDWFEHYQNEIRKVESGEFHKEFLEEYGYPFEDYPEE